MPEISNDEICKVRHRIVPPQAPDNKNNKTIHKEPIKKPLRVWKTRRGRTRVSMQFMKIQADVLGIPTTRTRKLCTRSP